MNVNLKELDGITKRGMRAPLSESDRRKLKAALHGMAEKLVPEETAENSGGEQEKRKNS